MRVWYLVSNWFVCWLVYFRFDLLPFNKNSWINHVLKVFVKSNSHLLCCRFNALVPYLRYLSISAMAYLRFRQKRYRSNFLHHFFLLLKSQFCLRWRKVNLMCKYYAVEVWVFICGWISCWWFFLTQERESASAKSFAVYIIFQFKLSLVIWPIIIWIQSWCPLWFLTQNCPAREERLIHRFIISSQPRCHFRKT